jgi:hypothetical protein
VVGGRWVADKGDREGKEASPGACTTWASAGLGVDLGVDLDAEGGLGPLVGLWWGLWWGLGGRRGRRQGRKGGPLHPDKGDPRMDRTPSVVNFVRSCLVTCTGAARATREAPATKTTRMKSGVSGGNVDWEVRVQISTQKLTRQSPHVVDMPNCMGMPSALHSH